MTGSIYSEQDFIRRITEITEANLKTEQFGVSDLAREMNMERSTLHRKVNKILNISVSQFINQIRLKKALDILQNSSVTVSETAYECGYHSVTYFSKCFHDYYGFAPGEVKKQNNKYINQDLQPTLPPKKKKEWLLASVLLSSLLIVLLFTHELYNFPEIHNQEGPEKTIAVLPFKNDSPDSANSYFINGLMESIINNLSNIEDLGVRSRTSVEKYREGNKSVLDIAKELDINYIVEGSGQKYGDEVLLNVQLIEAQNNRHLFSEQYRRKVNTVKELFDLQTDVALDVASKVNAEISVEEEKHIEKLPTESMAAYNFYLQGFEYLMLANKKPLWQFTEECMKAKQLLEEAIRLDTTFSDAYRHLAHNYINNLSFFSTDNYQAQKFLDTGLVLVNKALEYDNSNWGALAIKRQYFLKKGMLSEAQTIQQQLPGRWGDNHDIYEVNFSTSYWMDDYYNAIKSFYGYIRIKPHELPPYMIFMIAQCFTDMGYPEKGKKYAREFINQYNDSLSYYSTMALIEMISGKFQSSAEYGKLAFEIDSTDLSATLFLLINSIYQKNHREIKEYLTKLEKLEPNHPLWVNFDFFAGIACRETGLKHDANIYLQRAIKIHQAAIELNTHAAQRFEAHMYLSSIYAANGELDKSMEFLKMVKNRKTLPKTFLIHLQHCPAREELRESEEFQQVFYELKAKYQKEHQRIGELLREMEEV